MSVQENSKTLLFPFGNVLSTDTRLKNARFFILIKSVQLALLLRPESEVKDTGRTARRYHELNWIPSNFALSNSPIPIAKNNPMINRRINLANAINITTK